LAKKSRQKKEKNEEKKFQNRVISKAMESLLCIEFWNVKVDELFTL
jgi:hypothetical protein